MSFDADTRTSYAAGRGASNERDFSIDSGTPGVVYERGRYLTRLLPHGIM